MANLYSMSAGVHWSEDTIFEIKVYKMEFSIPPYSHLTVNVLDHV